jgi:murein DD-endopeptidase MepM/ murein hydrolase activator NlpD
MAALAVLAAGVPAGLLLRSHLNASAASGDAQPSLSESLASVYTSGTPSPTPSPTATVTPLPTSPPAPPPAEPPAADLPRPMFARPTDGAFTQGMNQYHPYGVDMGVNVGTEVRSVRDGVVTIAGGDACCGYGYYIVIEHPDGWTSLYAHLSAFDVRAGESVMQGQRIGLSGATGKAIGAHLHFELRHHGVVIDPLLYFPPN